MFERWRRREEDLERELQAHLEQEAEEHLGGVLSGARAVDSDALTTLRAE